MVTPTFHLPPLTFLPSTSLVRKGEGKMDGQIVLNELLVCAHGLAASHEGGRKSRKRIRMTDEQNGREQSESRVN